MARKPVYGLHSTSGQARTTVNGKRISPGKYGSPESKAKFDEVMAQWEADHAERNPAVQVSLTVSRLALLFMKDAIQEYVDVDGEPTGEEVITPCTSTVSWIVMGEGGGQNSGPSQSENPTIGRA